MIDFIAFVRVMQHYYFIHLINLINFYCIKHLRINQLSLSHHHYHRYCIWNTSSIVSVGLRNSRHFVALISSDALRYEVIMTIMHLFIVTSHVCLTLNDGNIQYPVYYDDNTFVYDDCHS